MIQLTYFPYTRVEPSDVVMKAHTLPITGALLIDLTRHTDSRGDFLKTFSASVLLAAGVDFLPVEHFLTRSRKDVIRGMHFQRPPHQHHKLVHCVAGCVQDVLLDLRTGSGLGQVFALELNADRPQALFVPEGVAHGFRVRSKEAVMMYTTSSEHQTSHDAGILWHSIPHHWDCANPIVSDRDQRHPTLCDTRSPF
jgi:dTDP-4-dehydrorhamnose 3,5-epimerase/CDP-3, 6-dideoxy-D-glycero-D-glycero-4-hexulose-5-epimerase